MRFLAFLLAFLGFGSVAFAGDTVVPQTLRHGGKYYIIIDSYQDGGDTISLYHGNDGSIQLTQNGNNSHTATKTDGSGSTDVTDDVEEANRDDPNEENSVPNGDDPPQV